MRGKFYLLGHPWSSISLSQQPGTAEYTWSSFLDLGSFFERQFFLTDRGGGRFWDVSSAVYLLCTVFLFLFPGGSVGKESTCSVGDPGSTPGLRRSPEEGNDSPLQYSCLKNSMDWGVLWLQSTGSQSVGHDWVTKHLFLLFHQLHLSSSGIRS